MEIRAARDIAKGEDVTINYGDGMSSFYYFMTHGFIEQENTIDVVPIKMTISPDHPSGSVVDTHDAYFNLTASLDEEEMRNFISFNRCTVSTYKVSNRL